MGIAKKLASDLVGEVKVEVGEVGFFPEPGVGAEEFPGLGVEDIAVVVADPDRDAVAEGLRFPDRSDGLGEGSGRLRVGEIGVGAVVGVGGESVAVQAVMEVVPDRGLKIEGGIFLVPLPPTAEADGFEGGFGDQRLEEKEEESERGKDFINRRAQRKQRGSSEKIGNYETREIREKEEEEKWRTSTSKYPMESLTEMSVR